MHCLSWAEVGRIHTPRTWRPNTLPPNAGGALANVDHLDENVLAELFATPPDEFVATRNRLAKQLKSDGDREAAERLSALRRPSWIDWALNTAAGDDASTVESFAAAAAEMRDAQRAAVAGRSDVDVRGALAELRDRSAALARQADRVLTGRGRPSALPELTERIAALAADPRATDELRAGRLQAESVEETIGFGQAGDDSAPRPKPKKQTAKPKPAKPQRRDDAAERRRLMREVARLERESRAAERDLGRTDTSIRQATAAVESATEAVNTANAALDRANKRLAEAEAERDRLTEGVKTTGEQLAKARQALDALGDDQ